MRILKKDIRSSKHFKKLEGTSRGWWILGASRFLCFHYYDNRAWFKQGSNTWILDSYFVDWQNPSQEEIVMFELQTGIKYLDYWLGLREE